MRASPLSSYFLLLQVFDKIGEAMFKELWSGEEIKSVPPLEDRRPIQNRITEIEAGLQGLELRRIEVLKPEEDLNLSPQESERRGSELRSIIEEQKQLRQELHELPDLSNYTFESEERFDRRKVVEKELLNAFQRKNLSLITGNFSVVDWNQWAVEPDFKVDFYLSTISTPERMGVAAVAPALIPIDEFKSWVKRFGYSSSASGDLPANRVLEDWLLEAFKRDPAEMIARDQFFDKANSDIPELSLRMFRAVWQNIAPESRKKGGRKRSQTINKPKQKP